MIYIEIELTNGQPTLVPALQYVNSGLINGDAVTVQFKTITAMGVNGVLNVPAIYSNNQLTFPTVISAANSTLLRLAITEKLTVTKGSVVNKKTITVSVKDSKFGYKRSSCSKVLPLNEGFQDVDCDDNLLVNGSVLDNHGNLNFKSTDGTLEVVVTDDGQGNVDVDLELAPIKALVIPLNAPAFVDGATPTVKVAVEGLQSQINALDKRPEAMGVLPAGGTKSAPTVLTPASMPLSVDNQDFYVAPSTSYYTLPNGTTVKLDSGEAVVLDKATGTYYTSRGLDNQLASDVPYSNTVSGLTATDVQGAIDEVTASNLLKMNKTQGVATGDKVLLSSGTTGVQNVESAVTKSILEGALTGYDVAEGSVETRLDDLEVTTLTGATVNTSQTNTLQIVNGLRYFVDSVGTATRLSPIQKVANSSIFVAQIPLNTTNWEDVTGIANFTLNADQGVVLTGRTSLISSNNSMSRYQARFLITGTNGGATFTSDMGNFTTPLGQTGTELQKQFSEAKNLTAGDYTVVMQMKLEAGFSNPLTAGDQSQVMLTYLDY